MSPTLLAQSALGGLLHGGIYALLALGLSLSWGLLRLVNLSHFALAFLGAYLTYQFGTVFGMPAWLSALVIAPAFFVIGVALHAVLVHYKVSEFASMLVTFGVTILIESLIQWIWSADFRSYDTPYAQASLHVGPLYVPLLELLAFLCAAVLAAAAWLGLHKTSLGKALRAAAHDGAIAAAFGINAPRLSYVLAGLCAASAGIAGVFIALTSTLAPSQIEAWIGVVFAVVIIGGLANPVGALAAGMLIGVSEAVTMAAVNPAWAPLVAFSILIILLLWKPKWL
jgi:branched-chain amino acid transport system permease protein